MRKTVRMAGSMAISAGILWLLFRETGQSPKEVAAALWVLGAGVWVAYAAAQLLQGGLRAVRYRLLLAGAGSSAVPGLGRMFGVTLARNMFVDMLPARAGELMYWALLNRGEGVASKDCVSSMTLSVWFDFLALAAVLGIAVVAPLAQAGGRASLLWGAFVVGGRWSRAAGCFSGGRGWRCGCCAPCPRASGAGGRFPEWRFSWSNWRIRSGRWAGRACCGGRRACRWAFVW